MRTLLLVLAAAALAGPVTGVLAQTSGEQISGTANVVNANGAPDTVEFTCFGRPVCTGTYSETILDVGCSNAHTSSGTFSITGLSLAAPGPLSGVFTISGIDSSYTHNPNGTCTYTAGTTEVLTFNYTGNWDGARGTLTFSCNYPTCAYVDAGDSFTFNATFTLSSSKSTPVFPVTVTGSITPTTANATATFQPRPQDAGTNASTYVFALAPAARVTGSLLAKDAPAACVLAQLNSNGQLAAVSASSIQAYATGVLSSQGQSVTILNNTSTPSVAGATFFVGYGATSSSMINSGVNVSAVKIPGADICVPQPPQTGWWWNAGEGGRGYSIEARDNKLFFAAYHYAASGRATWHVASGATSLDGSLFTGDLLTVQGGQTLGGAYPGFGTVTNAGPITLTFNGNSYGTMVWPGGTVAIERFNIVPGGLAAAPQANVPESGWWWNPAESGRGFFIEWQNGWVNVAGYMYDDAGNPVWYISVYTTPNPLAMSGNWWSYGNGQTMGGTYRAPMQLSNTVAPLTITFTSPTTATMNLPNGRTTALQRYRF